MNLIKEINPKTNRVLDVFLTKKKFKNLKPSDEFKILHPILRKIFKFEVIKILNWPSHIEVIVKNLRFSDLC